MLKDDPRTIVVVRDREAEALRHPEPKVFGKYTVTYVHASNAHTLPAASHYVFNLERLETAFHAHASWASRNGARVTFILKHVDAATAALLAASPWSVLPAFGDTEHIGVRTLRRALAMACDGAHVVARGFLANSGTGVQSGQVLSANPFVRLLRRISEQATQGESVVAAVLAPQRTGSQWLRDLIGWTVASDVRLFHEHSVPPEAEYWPASRSLLDALVVEPDPERQRRMRRAALSSALLHAQRRYIFVTYRDPVDRLISYFIKRHSQFLRERLDAASQTFLDPSEVQQAFAHWLPQQVKSHARWFRTTLFDHFGLDVCRAEASDGMLIGRHAHNTLVVVPIEMLNTLKDAVEATYGPDTCSPLADDSAFARGDGPVTLAFRRDIHVPPAVVNALHSIREVAYIRARVCAPVDQQRPSSRHSSAAAC
jgi:hypothetical protein